MVHNTALTLWYESRTLGGLCVVHCICNTAGILYFCFDAEETQGAESLYESGLYQSQGKTVGIFIHLQTA